jgi:hypothetical protein
MNHGRLFGLAAALFVFAVPPAARAAEATAPQCQAPEFRRLDFWLGDWEAVDVEAPDVVAARVQVTRILGGCVVREVYAGVDGLHGESYTIYDATRKLWHQTWVTNRGQLLEIEGRFEGERLTLEGTQRSTTGPDVRVRALWLPEKDGVRETAHTSSDGGATWKPLFDMRFKTRP